MNFYYITDDDHELDEATFWAYVRLKVGEIYVDEGMKGIEPLYGIAYWGDCNFNTDILEKVINNELNKLLNNES